MEREGEQPRPDSGCKRHTNWRKKLMRDITNLATAAALLWDPTISMPPPQTNVREIRWGEETKWSERRRTQTGHERRQNREQHQLQAIYNTSKSTSFASHTNPIGEQTAASEQIAVQRKEALEQKYNVNIDGVWTIEQLSVLERALQQLPENFALAHPGKRTVFITDFSAHTNASCLCYMIPHNPLIEPDKYEVTIGTNLLRNQKVANLMLVHELTHARSLVVLEVNGEGEKDENIVIIVWYQDEIERILDMPFKQFARTAKIKLAVLFPELYALSQQSRKISPEKEKKQNRPKSFVEQVTKAEFRDFNKVDRWRYAIGDSSFPYNKEYPVEFLAVLAEWYSQGKKVFMYNMEGIVTKDMAEALYEFLRIKIFDRVEYTQDGRAIKPPPTTRDNPLAQGKTLKNCDEAG